MDRMPVDVDRPDCFTQDSGEENCRACRFRKSCQKTREYLNGLKTVDDVLFELENKTEEPPPVGVKELLTFIVGEFNKVGGKLSRYHTHNSERWRATARRIRDSCLAAGIDPRLYARAQIQTVGVWTVRKKRFLWPNMLEGRKAQSRFEEWTAKNEEQYGDANRLTQKGEDTVRLAESMFVELYVEGDTCARAVERIVKKKYAGWSLTIGRRNPIVRLRAVRDYLAGVNVVLPRRLCLKTDRLKYGRLKRELLEVLQ